MNPPTITTQPLRSDNSEKPLVTSPNNDSITENVQETPEKLPKDFTEVTAVFDETGDAELSEEEKRRRRAATDCCCVAPYYADDTDVFCLYIMCRWVCECFAGIGRCTEDCFEGCADCLTGCCDGDGCCSSDAVDAGGEAAGEGCGDCLSSCLLCCTACDCDCST